MVGEGGGEGDLSAVAVARAWSCSGLVVARSMDLWWIGGGEVEGVGGRVAVVWWSNGGRTSSGGGQVAVALRAVARAI